MRKSRSSRTRLLCGVRREPSFRPTTSVPAASRKRPAASELRMVQNVVRKSCARAGRLPPLGQIIPAPGRGSRSAPVVRERSPGLPVEAPGGGPDGMERRSRELESGPGPWSAPGARLERSGSADLQSRSRRSRTGARRERPGAAWSAPGAAWSAPGAFSRRSRLPEAGAHSISSRRACPWNTRAVPAASGASREPVQMRQRPGSCSRGTPYGTR